MNIDNKVIPLRTLNAIDDEASIWLVRLDNGNLSEQSRIELRKWLSADERHRVALKAMADIWDDMDEILMIADNKSSPNKLSLWPILKPILKPVSLAASVSFIALLLWFSMPNDVHKNSYATLVGQQMDTTFNDGSIIHLNTNSHIETEFSDDKRIIKLIKGEALFEVAHDPNRPFIVYAGDRLVQAIGTKFIVHLKAEDIQVTVTDGKVKTSKVALNKTLADISSLDSNATKEDDFYITKGEKLVINKDKAPSLIQIEDENMDREISWLNGKLIFVNEKLSYVIEEINRYVEVEIVLKDPAMNNITISGRFDLQDSEALIEAIKLSFNMSVERLGSNKILLSKKI